MPAIPCEFDHNKDANGVEQYTGLTKREHFAAMAMQGLLGNQHIIKMDIREHSCIRDAIASEATLSADALILALEKQT